MANAKSDRVKILVINAGSSSIKSCLYDIEPGGDNEHHLQPVWKAQVNIKGGEGELKVTAGQTPSLKTKFKNENLDSGYAMLFKALLGDPNSPVESHEEIHAVGHRVVHGGEKYFTATKITDEVLRDLEKLTDLAPSHMPSNLKGIRVAQDHFPKSLQIAAFDTAFHSTMPDEAIIYAAPFEWYQERLIRRYGFHGISHSYCMVRAAQLVNKDPEELRMITCHLGSGGSLCAIKNGESVMTTMGFTPLEGLVMGTRSGSIDPGILFYLLGHNAYTAEELDNILNKESGLKGISGISGDMLEIQQAADQNNRRAQLAVEIYVRALVSAIASLLPVLGGLDVLSFAGGIGENSSSIRKLACERLTCIGVQIDLGKNELASVGDANISGGAGGLQTVVVHTNEELQIARNCMEFIEENQPEAVHAGA